MTRPSMRRALFAAIAVLGSAFGTSCAAVDPTEIIVLVDTNVPIAGQDGGPVAAGEIRTISFTVSCIAGASDPPCRLRDRDETTFTGLDQSYEQAGLGTRPPFYFVLRRDAAGLERTFAVTATAHLGPVDSIDETVTATALTTTVEGQPRVIVLPLLDDCISVTCGTGMTCIVGGGCGPIAQASQAWPGDCASIARPGLPMRECSDDLFVP